MGALTGPRRQVSFLGWCISYEHLISHHLATGILGISQVIHLLIHDKNNWQARYIPLELRSMINANSWDARKIHCLREIKEAEPSFIAPAPWTILGSSQPGVDSPQHQSSSSTTAKVGNSGIQALEVQCLWLHAFWISYYHGWSTNPWSTPQNKALWKAY